MVKQRITSETYSSALGSVVTLQSRRKIVGFMLALIGQFLFAEQVWACAASANSDLERLYCAVVAKGEGAGLPSYDDFRRNPPATQQLLLKRPAKRAGLAMPEPARNANAKMNAAASAKQNEPHVARSDSTAVPKNRAVLVKVPSNLKGCTLASQSIQCGNARYHLLDNRTNSALTEGALSGSNTLVLPPVPNYRSNLDLHNYLQRAYGIYLEKMDNIGLSGATLSYSKFYYIFDDTQQQQQDFVSRFALMYDFLKKDKSTMAVGKQHRGKTPPVLSMCQAIGDDFITCDQRGSNWVYARMPMQ